MFRLFGLPHTLYPFVTLLCVLLLAPVAIASPGVAPSDSTEAPSWATRIVAARTLVAAAEAAPRTDDGARLAAQALDATRSLSDDPAFATYPGLRALNLAAQAVYEAHHGPVLMGALSDHELFALRGDVLASITTEDPVLALAASAVPSVPARPSVLDAPDEAERLVAQQAQRFARSIPGYRQRAQRYLPMIERALEQRDLPEMLKYLPLIESGMNPGAVSPAGAIGLWQMLPSTGAMYGYSAGALYNPNRSTQAATRYLAYLGEMFDGDWHLALAAYNCGPGRVRGLVRRMERSLGRTPTFWDLYPHLPAETRAYVPRFIAVARALEDVA